MKSFEDRQQAFPNFPISGGGTHPMYEGMSLRDWFAGQALSGILACDETRGDGVERYPELCDVIAEASYGYADAMIAARKAGAA